MLGVIRHQGQDIKRIFQRLETMDESLNTLNQRLETVDGSLNTLKQHLNQIDTKFVEHTTLLTQILARLPKAP
jgi:archaellum component FlaC